MGGPLRMDKEQETIFIPYKGRLKRICHKRFLSDPGIKGLMNILPITSEMEVMNRSRNIV